MSIALAYDIVTPETEAEFIIKRPSQILFCTAGHMHTAAKKLQRMGINRPQLLKSTSSIQLRQLSVSGKSAVVILL